MFTYNAKTGRFWLNPLCDGYDDEFRLIGLLYGLAVYNNILIDVQFPLVLYRKLLGAPVTWRDFQDHDPVITHKDLFF